ncbi:MAG: hypothetical protein CMO74_02545 [Verrucomicrobiales bacterium]|nr:hypothetical protein [Verrucomicrobiales bacterium]
MISWRSARKDAERRGGKLATIDNDAEWEEFQEAAKDFRTWGYSWMGTHSDSENGWRWLDGREVNEDYFAIGEMEKAADGHIYGVYDTRSKRTRARDEKVEEGSGKQKEGLCSMPAIHRNVTAYIIEYESTATSSYMMNSWALSGHNNKRNRNVRQKSGQCPDNHPQVEEEKHKFWISSEMGGSNAPIFTEGVWADFTPRESDGAPKSLSGGDPMSAGIARACLNRYQDFANNVSFMDGRVESVQLSKLWTLKWHRQWKTPAKLPKLPKQ